MSFTRAEEYGEQVCKSLGIDPGIVAAVIVEAIAGDILTVRLTMRVHREALEELLPNVSGAIVIIKPERSP